MNMIWKRTLSLALSAVLLMSNVPFAALATENTATETQPVETHPAFEQGTTDAANHGEGDPGAVVDEPEKYDVWINGTRLEEGKTSDQAGTYSYDAANKVLTLKDARIDTIKTEVSLTIELIGKNKVTANGDGVSAIFADKDSSLTIQNAGENMGVLEVISYEAHAVHIADSNPADEKKPDLMIKGIVTMSAASGGVADNLFGIYSANGVRVEGNVHLKLDKAASPKSLRAKTGTVKYTLPVGYIVQGNECEEVQGVMEMDNLPFEFVSLSHLGEGYSKNEDVHYKSCADEACPLRYDVAIQLGEHENVTEANCQSGASCSVCGVFSDPDETKHSTNDTAYKTENGKHILVHALETCRKPMPGAEEGECRYSYVCQNGCIKRVCEVCEDALTVFQIIAPSGDDLAWNGEAKTVQIQHTFGEDKTFTPINYRGSVAPENVMNESIITPGTYYVEVSVDIDGTTYRPCVEIVVPRKQLTADDITVLNADNLTYHEAPEEPLKKRDVTVAGLETDDYQVEYYRGTEKIEENGDFNSAGIITVKVTVLGDDKNYYGSAEKTYEIQKASVSETAAMAPEVKELVYDGTVKTLSVTKTGVDQTRDYGEKVVFYKNREEVKDPIDAGTYTLKIHVGNQNYTDAVFESKGEPWSATIKPCKTYTASFEDEQIIGDHIAAFQPPVFTGVTRAGASEPETVAGTCVYEFTYNGQTQTNIAASEIAAKLNAMSDGTQATLKFVFTPTANGNYTGTKDGTITITKAGVTFTNDGKAVNYMDLLSGGSQVVNYGAANIVNVSKLEAKSNGVTDDVDAHFTVKYAMAKTGGGYDDAPEKLLNKPNAGSAQFIVFYSNPNLGGTAFENVEVTRGNITVNKIAPPTEDTTLLKPVKKELTETEGTTKEQQELITPGRDGTIPLEYSLDGTNYSSAVPKAAQAGVYRVYYRSPENANYTTPVEGHVDSVIKPYLTATFGDTLEDVVLPESGEWTWQQGDKKLEELSVGNAGVTRTYKLNYASKTVSGLTGEFTAEIHVAPKPITVKIELKEEHKHMSYKNGAAVKAAVKVTNLADNKTLTNGTDYELEYQNETKRGRATVTVTPKGNYTFTVPEEESVLEYVIYDVAAIALTDTTTFEGSNVEDKNGKDVKDALDEEFEDVYSDELRKYTYFIMKETDNTYTFEPFYWPEDGIALNINYPTNSHKDDGEYKVFAMYLVGDKAGTVIELEEATGTLGMNQFKKGESTFSVKMDNYMAICIAEKVDPNATYKVSTSASNGKVEFTVGSDTTKKTSADAVKVGEKLTITATPNSNYALTKIQYIYKDGTTNKAKEVKQNDDGKYILEMPAMDITIKATFAKKTTNTKNPYSGDTSNITLWFTVLVASGVGIAALMAFWFKKRRK